MSPTVDMLEKLAEALGIGLRDFFRADRKPLTRRKR
jgi:hypothetical protein